MIVNIQFLYKYDFDKVDDQPFKKKHVTNTKLGQILIRLMANKGLRITELARHVNLPQPTIHRIATGTIANPHLSSLKPIADFFSITVDQLKGLEPIPDFDQVLKVPLLDWSEVIRWRDNKADIISKEFIVTDARVSQDSYALKVKDASMDPVFPNDTILIVDPNKQSKDRSYVIVKLAKEPEPIFRQLIIDVKKYYLKALSPDLEQYKLARVDHNDTLLGILVQTKRNYEE